MRRSSTSVVGRGVLRGTSRSSPPPASPRQKPLLHLRVGCVGSEQRPDRVDVRCRQSETCEVRGQARDELERAARERLPPTAGGRPGAALGAARTRAPDDRGENVPLGGDPGARAAVARRAGRRGREADPHGDDGDGGRSERTRSRGSGLARSRPVRLRPAPPSRPAVPGVAEVPVDLGGTRVGRARVAQCQLGLVEAFEAPPAVSPRRTRPVPWACATASSATAPVSGVDADSRGPAAPAERDRVQHGVRDLEGPVAVRDRAGFRRRRSDDHPVGAGQLDPLGEHLRGEGARRIDHRVPRRSAGVAGEGRLERVGGDDRQRVGIAVEHRLDGGSGRPVGCRRVPIRGPGSAGRRRCAHGRCRCRGVGGRLVAGRCPGCRRAVREPAESARSCRRRDRDRCSCWSRRHRWQQRPPAPRSPTGSTVLDALGRRVGSRSRPRSSSTQRPHRERVLARNSYETA